MQLATTDQSAALFKTRRLAHSNIFVSDYVKACDFYHDAFGFAEAYRQPDNLASFLSNGNTYHDFALVDVKSKYAKPGQRPGLNHLAFEVESEDVLVAGYKAALAAGVEFLGAADHDVAHSIYLKDPDGNEVEFYADVVEDWEEARKGIIIKKKPQWIPGETNVPDTRQLFKAVPNLKRLSNVLVQGKRVTHMGLAVRDFDAMYDFYTRVAGLRPFFGDRASQCVLLAGFASSGDISLLRNVEANDGMHHMGVEVWSEADLEAAVDGIKRIGGQVMREVDHAARHAVCVTDADGLLVQLYVNRDWRPDVIATADAADLPFLL
ncbi:VOC family protein [Paraburkholderia lycopersici]|uniref:Catechol 2,3-dioxygenase n=1 Tax=Paraburkholderia lycopersici TaxID=416944 RepID=A0A1G6LX40_9BURK|nr:VOC family protein [Paraburkholderia lycopersici]SDC47833.1 catechol 2,3-dioxygenase [Paraburkholderia lycopersici]